MSAPSPKFQKLLSKLRELFELDKADLDFGLYRVLRARRDEIDRFLREDLLPQVREELGVVTEEKIKPMESKVQDEIANVMKYGGKSREEAEASPTVLEAKALLEQARNPAVLEDEVYSLLTTFFGRYYEAGDFVSQRRYSGPGRERYMLPYNGEEVKLVWANMDQYYIKSAENFRDYTFRVPALEPDEAVPEPDTRLRVSFKLVSADTESDNVKAGAKRCFILGDLAEDPARLRDNDGEKELVIPVEYRVLSHSDWDRLPETLKQRRQGKTQSEKSKTLYDELAEKRDAKKDGKPALNPPNQDQANQISGAVLVEALKGMGSEGKLLLAPAPTDTCPWRTLVEKHLATYTAKNSFDYFIHRDLGAFLNRELDYFLKSEVLRIDDLLTEDNHQRDLTLKKARALKKVSEKVVTFLHRQEQFQKKLWLKKKFVVACDYAISLDRLAQIPDELYAEIASNEAQRKEWVKLHAIDEIEGDLGQPAYTVPLSVAFLKSQPSLMVDTRHFTSTFKQKVIESIGDFDAQCDGVVVKSENFAGLAMLQARYWGCLEFIYTDPPYNTGDGDFSYKDSFFHSSWLAFLADRHKLAMDLLQGTGRMAVSLDDAELPRYRQLINQLSGDPELAILVWDRNRKNDARYFSVGHEYMVVLAKSRKALADQKLTFREPREGLEEAKELFAKARKEYGEDWDKVRDAWLGWLDAMLLSDPRRRMRRFTKVGPRGPYRDDGDISWPGGGGPKYKVFHPITKRACKTPRGGWVYSKEERFWEEYEKGRVVFGPDETTLPRQVRFLFEDEGQVMPSVFYSYAQTASVEFRELMGGKVFENPKPWGDLLRLARYLGSPSTPVLDYFAGSGSTAHAIINLNREEGKNRKYILIEMGDHFDTVLVPRIKRVVYSPDWKEGTPVTRDKGISHCVKILKLESYEDCLNNLVLTRNPDQEDLLKKNKDLREDYLLGYFLDVETRGSVLKLDHFRDPWNYRMKIATGSVGETRESAIDLVETFNWLLGLSVRYQSAIQYRRPDKGFVEDEHSRLQLIGGLTRGADPTKDVDTRGFQTVEGTLRSGENVLVIWRSLTPAKDGEDAARLLEEDNVMLESFLSRTGLNPREKQWDLIYVNGDHTLDNLAERLADEGEAPRFKVRTIEPEFHRLMFEGTED